MFEAHLTIYGNPVTKKNSQRMVYVKGRMIPIPSAQYKKYEKSAKDQLLGQIGEPEIDFPLNIKCVYYMQTRRKCDLVNLLEASLDILVAANVLKDDNYTIASMHDGSRVSYDKENPRVEIELREMLPFEPDEQEV